MHKRAQPVESKADEPNPNLRCKVGVELPLFISSSSATVARVQSILEGTLDEWSTMVISEAVVAMRALHDRRERGRGTEWLQRPPWSRGCSGSGAQGLSCSSRTLPGGRHPRSSPRPSVAAALHPQLSAEHAAAALFPLPCVSRVCGRGTFLVVFRTVCARLWASALHFGRNPGVCGEESTMRACLVESRVVDRSRSCPIDHMLLCWTCVLSRSFGCRSRYRNVFEIK